MTVMTQLKMFRHLDSNFPSSKPKARPTLSLINFSNLFMGWNICLAVELNLRGPLKVKPTSEEFYRELKRALGLWASSGNSHRA